MKMTNVKKSLSFFLCIVLIAVMALLTTGCNGNKTDEDPSEPSSQANSVTTTVADSTTAETTETEAVKNFTFTVTHLDGTQKTFEISTTKKTVGEALLDEGIIEGEDGPYGLYVKTVDGETLDYDKDGKYWAFYEGDKYAAKGVDLTTITEGATYSFKAE